MSEGRYHRWVKDTIYKIAKESGKYNKVLKERKVPLTHPTQPTAPIMYLPEIVLITKHGKKYIFEILDSQGTEANLIIADIIQSYLIENISKVFFIAKNKEEYDLTDRLSTIIGARLEDNGYHKKDLPIVTIYEISKSDLNRNKLYGILKEFAKKDGWA